MTGTTRRISATATPRPASRTRRRAHALPRTAGPMPMAWNTRKSGNANIDGLSRIHVLNDVASSQANRGSSVWLIRHPSLLRERRRHGPLPHTGAVRAEGALVHRTRRARRAHRAAYALGQPLPGRPPLPHA